MPLSACNLRETTATRFVGPEVVMEPRESRLLYDTPTYYVQNALKTTLCIST